MEGLNNNYAKRHAEDGGSNDEQTPEEHLLCGVGRWARPEVQLEGKDTPVLHITIWTTMCSLGLHNGDSSHKGNGCETYHA